MRLNLQTKQVLKVVHACTSAVHVMGDKKTAFIKFIF